MSTCVLPLCRIKRKKYKAPLQWKSNYKPNKSRLNSNWNFFNFIFLFQNFIFFQFANNFYPYPFFKMNTLVKIGFGLVFIYLTLPRKAEAISCYVCRTSNDTTCGDDDFPLAHHNVTSGFNLCVVRMKFYNSIFFFKLLSLRFMQMVGN